MRIARIRIGQPQAVEWFLLKVKGSYHDNIERLCLTKWSHQLAAEIGLSDWIQDELREICTFEVMKAFLYTPFNRYSLVIGRDILRYDLDYHSPVIVRSGHLLSIVVKVILSVKTGDEDFWNRNMPYLVMACFGMAEKHELID